MNSSTTYHTARAGNSLEMSTTPKHPRFNQANTSTPSTPEPSSSRHARFPSTPPTKLSRAEAEKLSRPEAQAMERQDSGYESRTSVSSISRPSLPRRSSSRKHRPTPKRASRSTPSVNPPSSSSNGYSSSRRSSHQYFTFPSLEPEDAELPPASHTPPPATVHYWTSEETRRLEYAAIDAASKGVRGLLSKMVPDCMVPKEQRRVGFHTDDNDSDAGSVRRYRLSLSAPEEKRPSKPNKRPSFWRRWTSSSGRA